MAIVTCMLALVLMLFKVNRETWKPDSRWPCQPEGGVCLEAGQQRSSSRTYRGKK